MGGSQRKSVESTYDTPMALDQNYAGRGSIGLAIHVGKIIVPIKEVCDVVSIHIVSII